MSGPPGGYYGGVSKDAEESVDALRETGRWTRDSAPSDPPSAPDGEWVAHPPGHGVLTRAAAAGQAGSSQPVEVADVGTSTQDVHRAARELADFGEPGGNIVANLRYAARVLLHRRELSAAHQDVIREAAAAVVDAEEACIRLAEALVARAPELPIDMIGAEIDAVRRTMARAAEAGKSAVAVRSGFEETLEQLDREQRGAQDVIVEELLPREQAILTRLQARQLELDRARTDLMRATVESSESRAAVAPSMNDDLAGLGAELEATQARTAEVAAELSAVRSKIADLSEMVAGLERSKRASRGNIQRVDAIEERQLVEAALERRSALLELAKAARSGGVDVLAGGDSAMRAEKALTRVKELERSERSYRLGPELYDRDAVKRGAMLGGAVIIALLLIIVLPAAC